MKKSDLRTGMKVETMDGQEWIVMLNAHHEYDETENFLLNLSVGGWMRLDRYDDDLKIIDRDDRFEYDIKNVYEPDHLMYLFLNNSEYVKWSKIKRKMTKKEIEEELGYKIEIIEE